MYRLLGRVQSRLSLTTNIWTSKHSQIPYCCLTVHFINDDWDLQKRIMAFKNSLSAWRYSARTLNLIVQDGLSQVRGLLEKIRETARYLKKSPSAAQKFKTALDEYNLKDKRKVEMDVPNRWNSTYELLEIALPHKEAFCRLQRIDKQYLFNPSEPEWEFQVLINYLGLKWRAHKGYDMEILLTLRRSHEEVDEMLRKADVDGDAEVK
ncbi:hypothetical protein BUALT_Bualt15G0128800 [Buddleja alternifolia]|uniref:Uncharacterized protein n=1 Tax=Buddleja alternifolia TaxID=168488 RepID=A0AAV6WQD8_9LAMI|nr:hypothetical protein BUALT_Bualt15G0128800 [Buddleja alternifolia]